LSTDGQKIPFLSKTTIFKLMKSIGKTISVAIYVEYEYNNSTEKIVVEIYPNGLITVTSDLNKAVTTEEMNNILKTGLNPIFKEVENKSNKITIDDLAKVEIRVGQIKSATPVEGSEKLLILNSFSYFLNLIKKLFIF
jgi:hypothetical protein